VNDEQYQDARIFLLNCGIEPTDDALEQLIEVFLPCLKIMCSRPWAPDGSTWRASGINGAMTDAKKKWERFWERTWKHGKRHDDSGFDHINYVGFVLRSDPESGWGEWGPPSVPAEEYEDPAIATATMPTVGDLFRGKMESMARGLWQEIPSSPLVPFLDNLPGDDPNGVFLAHPPDDEGSSTHPVWHSSIRDVPVFQHGADGTVTYRGKADVTGIPPGVIPAPHQPERRGPGERGTGAALAAEAGEQPYIKGSGFDSRCTHGPDCPVC
jgi:hypothetical protein